MTKTKLEKKGEGSESRSQDKRHNISLESTFECQMAHFGSNYAMETDDKDLMFTDRRPDNSQGGGCGLGELMSFSGYQEARLDMGTESAT